MSREIKFRAWVNDHWVDWIPTCKTLGAYNASIIDTDGYTFEENNPFIVEQYTGLKDKNGKEIYEGDIVNIQGIKYYVDFEHGGFWFSNDNRKWKAYRPFTHFQEINDAEVIGNIHENPELLEDGNE